MLVVENKHHIKLFVECLNSEDQTKTLNLIRDSFPDATIYEEISEDDYSEDLVVAESHSAYSGMNPSQMLKFLRQDQGLTQSELAQQVGTSKTSISAMEKGSRPITQSMAIRLAKILVTNPRVLLEKTYPRFREL